MENAKEKTTRLISKELLGKNNIIYGSGIQIDMTYPLLAGIVPENLRNGARSRIHSCYNGIGSWFYQSLGGIMKDENIPGYKHFIIDSDIPEGITWTNTTKETSYGTVTVKWEIEMKQVSIKINIPVGSTARVIIPESIYKYRFNEKIFTIDASSIELKSGYNYIEYVI